MFKSYSSKSKAVRGLLSFIKGVKLTDAQIADVVHLGKPEGSESDPEVDLKWGFYEHSANKLAGSELDQYPQEPVAPVGEPAPVEYTAENFPGLQETAAPVVGTEHANEDYPPADDYVAPIGNMFGGMAATLGAVAQTAAPVAQTAAPVRYNDRTGHTYTIEKNRLEQNGIKRPSIGTLCREIWDTLDLMTDAQGFTVTAKQLRALAAEKQWDNTTGTIQFYRWRKFNGITGRAAKAE